MKRFVRITPDGTVSYSQRLTLAAGCSMNLVKFPLDSQTCKLEIGSFGYTAKDVIYRYLRALLLQLLYNLHFETLSRKLNIRIAGGKKNLSQLVKRQLWLSFILLMLVMEKTLGKLEEEIEQATGMIQQSFLISSLKDKQDSFCYRSIPH